MLKPLVLVAYLATITNATAFGGELQDFLFSEGFNDAQLASRNWYDLTRTRIVGDAAVAEGCLEYEWSEGTFPRTEQAAIAIGRTLKKYCGQHRAGAAQRHESSTCCFRSSDVSSRAAPPPELLDRTVNIDVPQL